jgi:alkaline phosphatase
LGKGDLPTQAGTCGYGGPACTYPNGEVSYKTTGHTNELVRLYAKGRGSELFRRYEGTLYPGAPIIDNTQIYHVLLKAAGL